MANLYAPALPSPVGGEQICNKTAVAFLGARLGAQKRNFGRPGRRIERVWDAALLHQPQKPGLVGWPVLVISVGLQQFGCGRELRLVGIANVRDFFEEIGDVRMFRIAGKLSAAILSNIDNTFHARLLKEREKLLGGLSREADRAEKNFHGNQKYSAASGEERKANS